MNAFENELAKNLCYYITEGPLSEEQAIIISKEIAKNLAPYIKEQESDNDIIATAIVNISQQISDSDFEVSQKIKMLKSEDTIETIKKWYLDLDKEYPSFKGQIKLIFIEK